MIQGIWTTPNRYDESYEKYIHKLEIKCIENIGNFGIGIKERENKLLLRLNVDDKNDKGKVYLMRNDRVIKESNVKGVKCGDTLSVKVRYVEEDYEGIREAKFYFNGKLLCDARFSQYTYDGDSSTFCHPLFLFDTNQSKQGLSKYQITCCHLYKCQEYTQSDDELIIGVEERIIDNQQRAMVIIIEYQSIVLFSFTFSVFIVFCGLYSNL